jgi:antitoxin CcdA
MTTQVKRKVSITLDADLVAALEAEHEDNLSARVNAALRADVEQRGRRRALGELLDRLAAEEGALDTAEDEAAIARFMRLLGGVADEPRTSRRAS